MKTKNMTTLHLRKSIGPECFRACLLVALALCCFALAPAPKAFGVSPPPDGGYPNNTTAEGTNALFSLGTGINNTAVGTNALSNDSTGGYNVAVGSNALALNTSGSFNMAIGTEALRNNTASANLAIGFRVLYFNNTGHDLTGVGAGALYQNTASFNTAVGAAALNSNTTGDTNTAVGRQALLSNTTGSNNVAVGSGAGIGTVTASNNIAIGSAALGPFANLSNTCWIGSIDGEPTSDSGSTVAVMIDSNNVLGTSPSSRRVKHDIKPMDKASEVILALKPVTFHYNSDVKGTPCFGLIAEDVAEVSPDLVVRDKEGQPQTVRYEQVNAMLLNEFLKEHKRVEVQQASISQLKSEMQTMVAQLKEQAAQIQKVSAQLEVNKPAPKVVVNKP
jgi:hypothetical protein